MTLDSNVATIQSDLLAQSSAPVMIATSIAPNLRLGESEAFLEGNDGDAGADLPHAEPAK
jgi:hypothetical protein